jgi:hypothetical protein
MFEFSHSFEEVDSYVYIVHSVDVKKDRRKKLKRRKERQENERDKE